MIANCASVIDPGGIVIMFPLFVTSPDRVGIVTTVPACPVTLPSTLPVIVPDEINVSTERLARLFTTLVPSMWITAE